MGYTVLDGQRLSQILCFYKLTPSLDRLAKYFLDITNINFSVFDQGSDSLSMDEMWIALYSSSSEKLSRGILVCDVIH